MPLIFVGCGHLARLAAVITPFHSHPPIIHFQSYPLRLPLREGMVLTESNLYLKSFMIR